MSMTELKEFISETVMKDTDETEEVIEPLVEEALEKMSKTELKKVVMETVVENNEEAVTTQAPSFANFPQMEFKENIEDDRQKITEPKNVDDINKMTMQELKDFIEKNSAKPKTEKPQVQEKLEIKDGMLFKNGMTMKEIKAEKKDMTVKELVGKEEGLGMRDINKIQEGVSVEEMIAMKNDVRFVYIF